MRGTRRWVVTRPPSAGCRGMVPIPAERDMPAGHHQAVLVCLMSEVSESAGLSVGGRSSSGRPTYDKPAGPPALPLLTSRAQATAVPEDGFGRFGG